MKTQIKVVHTWLRFQLFNIKAAPLLLLQKIGSVDLTQIFNYLRLHHYYYLFYSIKIGGVITWDCSLRTNIEVAFQNFPFLFSNSSIHFYCWTWDFQCHPSFLGLTKGLAIYVLFYKHCYLCKVQTICVRIVYLIETCKPHDMRNFTKEYLSPNW